MSDGMTMGGLQDSDGRCFINVGWKHPGVAGFISVDVDFDESLSRELTVGFPFEDGSVDGILCEDLIHRLSRPDGVNLLRACRRIMADGATLRVATMDLRSVTRSYLDMADQPAKHGRGRPCELLNNLFQAEATQWIYDEDELARMAQMAGLELVTRQAPGCSREPAFRDRMDYLHCDLVMEFTLPNRTVSEDVQVSVLIPASRPTFFKDALQTVFEQSFRNLEIIVCDDSQGDEIKEICDEFSGKELSVKYVRNSEPLGALGTMRHLFELSTGEYIKYLSDDDLLHPECVERLSSCLQAYPWVTLACSYRQMVDSGGDDLLRRGSNSRLVFEDSIVDGLSAVNLLLETHTNFIGGPSAALFRRKDIAEGLDGLMSFHGVDGEPLGSVALWMKLLSQGDLVYLVQAMSQYRQHPAQTHRQPEFEDGSIGAWTQLELVGRQLGFLVTGAELTLKTRPLATRPWWSNVVVRIYREASEQVNEKGLAESSEPLLKLAAMLPDEPWPPVVLAESFLAGEEPEKALSVMSPTLSRHRDYFPAYALAGSALANLGKADDAAAVFAEGCVWALPMFSSRGLALGLTEPFELQSARRLWIQTGRFRFAISFKLVITVVPDTASLPIRIPVYLDSELATECAFYGAGDSTLVTLETSREQQDAVVTLGPIEDLSDEEDGSPRIRLLDFRVVLIGKLT